MSTSDLTIIIPTKDRISDLQRLLKSFAGQSDGGFELLIVNNGGPEVVKAVESVSQGLPIRIVPDATPNIPHLFNHALTSTNSDIVGFLNDDTEVNPSWVHEVRQTFTGSPQAAAVGGPCIDQDRQLMQKTQKWMQRRLITRFLFRIANSILYEGKFFDIGYMSDWGTYSIGGSMQYSANLPTPIIVKALSVTNMAVRRNFLEKLGGFDESFKFSGADGDLFVRLGRMGAMLLFNPRLSVLHYASPTKGNAGTRSVYWLSRDYLLFLRKLNPAGLSGWFKRVLALMGLVSFWGWQGISNGRPGLAVSSLNGLRAGLRVQLNADGHSPTAAHYRTRSSTPQQNQRNYA